MIDLSNYEDYMLRGVDNELEPAELAALHVFLEQHPSLMKEWRALGATRLDATEKILFKDKESLYRHQAVRPWWHTAAGRRWAAAAAAALMLVAGYLWMKSGRTPEAVSSVPAYAGTAALPQTPGSSIRPANSPSVTGSTPPGTGASVRDSGAFATRGPQLGKLRGIIARHPVRTPAAGQEGEERNPPPKDSRRDPAVAPLAPVTLAELQATEPLRAPRGVAGSPHQAAMTPPDEATPVTATTRLEDRKRELDESITDGLGELQQKKTALLSKLGKGEIRIGRFTLALNP
jgi:hypothetical protein